MKGVVSKRLDMVVGFEEAVDHSLVSLGIRIVFEAWPVNMEPLEVILAIKTVVLVVVLRRELTRVLLLANESTVEFQYGAVV